MESHSASCLHLFHRRNFAIDSAKPTYVPTYQTTRITPNVCTYKYFFKRCEISQSPRCFGGKLESPNGYVCTEDNDDDDDGDGYDDGDDDLRPPSSGPSGGGSKPNPCGS